MKTLRPLAFTLILGVAATASAGNIATESFETDPGTSYTLSAQFDDGGFDFFDRYLVPETENAARDDFQNGWDGEYGIIGQDHDGDGESPTQSISLNPISITGQTDIAVTVAAGALSSENADPAFENYEVANGDGIKIYATIDGGSRDLIGAFAPPVMGSQGTPEAGDLYEDTDLDGFGDGVVLTADLSDHTFPVAGTGDLLVVELELTSTSSFEPIAVDNVRVSAVPEPSSIVLVLIGCVTLLRFRRS